MGIAYCLIRVAPETVTALSGRPRAVAEFVYGDPNLYEAPKPNFITRLLRKRKGEVASLTPVRRDGDEIDIDKAWHIVHFLLTGCVGRADSPLGLIGDDLHPLADIDLGLGRPNIISASEVKSFADNADRLTDNDFLTRFVPEQMPTGDLYLGEVISRGDHEEMREYALENFQLMRAFVRQAADDREAIITYYT